MCLEKSNPAPPKSPLREAIKRWILDMTDGKRELALPGPENVDMTVRRSGYGRDQVEAALDELGREGLIELKCWGDKILVRRAEAAK